MLRRSLVRWAAKKGATPAFAYSPIFPHCHDDTPYRLLSKDHVSVVKPGNGIPDILRVDAKALTLLAEQAFKDISHLLRPGHLAQLRTALEDTEATDNDRFVALQLLKNANIAAGGLLPMCQDTGTAIVMGHKGEQVFTSGDDGEALSLGVYNTYTKTNLRYSQVAPLTVFDEKNTGTNLPAQIDIYADKGAEYEFLFMAKGGGSANKTYLYQETKAVLNPKALRKFLEEKITSIGTSACPPYHLAIVIGGTSAEATLKTVKLASARYLDNLPTKGSDLGHAFRDLALEKEVHAICQSIGIGAQFGGKYFAHDVRVIRLPRHGASCPIGVGVSCSADRQAKAKINADGIWLEELEHNPAKYLPDIKVEDLLPTPAVKIDLNQSMDKVRETLSQYPTKTRLSLTGTIVVARDMAHARIRERLEKGEPMPQYLKDYVVYYAGPAKTPEGMPSGSFGPTTAGRMDSFTDLFQQNGGSYVMLAKGNRSRQVTEACKKHGGFYLGSIGGPAALLAQDSIKKVEVLDMEELGMEAVWKIDVEDFPAFIVVDNKGNDFFQQLK